MTKRDVVAVFSLILFFLGLLVIGIFESLWGSIFFMSLSLILIISVWVHVYKNNGD